MKRPRLTTRPLLWALPVVVLLGLSIPKLWQGDFNVDTGHYSAIALQAWRSALDGQVDRLWALCGMGGDPADGGTFYFNKPPAAFWIHGLALAVAGPSVLVARLPSVLAAVLALGFTMLAVRAVGGRRLAILTGLILALTPEFVRYDRAFSLDLHQLAGLMACVAGVLTAERARGTGRVLRLVGGGVGLGFALLVKPLVALVALPLLLVWMLAPGRIRAAAGLAIVAAAALVIALPWHASMYLQHGAAFTDQYFGRQIIDRARGLLDMNDGAASPWYYARVVLTSWWPWLATFVLGAWAFLQARPFRTSQAARVVFLPLLWTIGWVVLMSCFADKRPRYLLLVQPMVAWVSAWWLLEHAPRAIAALRRPVLRFAGPVVVVGAMVVSALPVNVHTREPAHWRAALEFLRSADPKRTWAAGLSPMGASRVYLAHGYWPRPTRDYRPQAIPTARPAIGDMLIYERRAGLWTTDPGPGERIIFAEGDITITTLEAPSDAPR
ncbi:MAG: ArnT family glycosyltransferase [Phycisphaerales bacterium]